MTTMDRAAFVKKTGAALALLFVPLPRAASAKPDVAAVLEGQTGNWPEGMVGLHVSRGNSYRTLYVSPELLEDGSHGMEYVERAVVEPLAHLHADHPGRATQPVKIGGRYRLIDSLGRPLADYEPGQWQKLADERWMLVARLVDA